MATVNAVGTARVSFNVEVDVDVEDLVSDELSVLIPADLSLEDFEIDRVEGF